MNNLKYRLTHDYLMSARNEIVSRNIWHKQGIIMANSRDHGVADEMTRVAADGARKGNDRAADTARKVAGAAQESTQHVVDE